MALPATLDLRASATLRAGDLPFMRRSAPDTTAELVTSRASARVPRHSVHPELIKATHGNSSRSIPARLPLPNATSFRWVGGV